jgi:cytochrome c-type biogenesis protein
MTQSDLLFQLTDAVSGTPALALGASLVWGIISVLLSPCHLGTIPLVVGFVGAGSKTSRGRGAALAFSFAGGMLAAILLVGLIVFGLGHALTRLGSVSNYLIAVVFLLAGLNLVGILPMPEKGLSLGSAKGKGLVAAATVGLVLGIGLSPCTFAFIAPILGATAGSAARNPALSAGMLLAFGIGHCGVIGGAGSSTEWVQRYLDWNEGSRTVQVAKFACGLLVLAAAAMLVYLA